MSSVTLYCEAGARLGIVSFPGPSLAEQARKRQNQKERKMIKELADGSGLMRAAR